MPYFTYDTSVIVSRKIRDLHEMPKDFLLSAVVLMELTAGASDSSVRKIYEQLYHQYRRDQLLIVPNDDDWLLAAKIMFLLAQARRTQGKGKLKRLPPGLGGHLKSGHVWSLENRP